MKNIYCPLFIVNTWFFVTTFDQKIDCFALASFFSFVEFIWRGFHEDPVTQIKYFAMFDIKRCNTSKEQFLLNLFFSPITLHLYKYLINNIYLQFILFPLNVWITELVQGSYLLKIHEKRVWEYKDQYALCNNLISISYIFYWYLLAIPYVFYAETTNA